MYLMLAYVIAPSGREFDSVAKWQSTTLQSYTNPLFGLAEKFGALLN